MSKDTARQTPVLDEWRAQVGDESVAAAVEAARVQIADGSLPALSDPGAFLEHVRGPRAAQRELARLPD